MRAFFCLPIDAGLRAEADRVASRLRRGTTMPASWVRPENYHITVRFLGEIEPALTASLEEAARHVSRATAPFELRVDEVGAFPSIDRARVLWVGGAANSAFERLVRSLERHLGELGFPPEREPAVAHLTIARIKGRPDVRLPRLMEALGPLPSHSLHVDRLVLMESRLSPRGPAYDPLFSAPLGGVS
ncbi:MAG: RNA 2',3'-cyclic phosphodiesterase [Candidatus Bipolaricaulis sp.]|nr:RNA 2',3'-cyclic phosphodiesterase [Candidatus Bipolaricaulis sp.]